MQEDKREVIEIKDILDSRINSVATTVDKVMHVLVNTNNFDPPLNVLSKSDILKRFWVNGKSVIS